MKYLSDATLTARMERLWKACARDQKRFQPNPLGRGYLTRQERWMEVYTAYKNEYRRRLDAKYHH